MTSPLTDRVRRRIARDYPARVDEVELLVAGCGDAERVQAAAVLAAHGDLDTLRAMCALAALDPRDLFVNGGLAHADWPEVLDRELGPLSRRQR